MPSCLPGSGDGGLCLDGSASWSGLALQWLRAVAFSGFSVFKPYSLWRLAILEARYIGRKSPVVKRVPIELSDLSVSQTTGKKLSYFVYEFEVPWDDIDESKSRLIGGN